MILSLSPSALPTSRKGGGEKEKKNFFFFFTLSHFGLVENFYNRELSIELVLKKDTMFFHQVTITSKKGEWLLASK